MKNQIVTISISGTALLLAAFGCSQSPKEPGWQKARVIAEKLDSPSAITTEGESIYFVTGGTVASLNEGTSGVWKMSVSGGEPTQLFKGVRENERSAILPDTWVLDTDEKYLYWSSGYISRTPKAGGASEKLVPGTPTKMVLDDDTIYWQNFVGESMPPVPLYSAPKKGGEAKPITEPLIASGLAIDKDFLYWAQPEGIFRMSKSGGEQIKVYSPPGEQTVRGLTADAEFFYFAQGSGTYALMKLAKNSGSPVQLAPSINTSHEFYTDDTHIYFITNYQTFSTALNKVGKIGGDVTQIDTGYVKSFTVGKDKIFVTDISKIYALDKSQGKVSIAQIVGSFYSLCRNLTE
jgi:hypothetical protein